jgi:hypothetical protein
VFTCPATTYWPIEHTKVLQTALLVAVHGDWTSFNPSHTVHLICAPRLLPEQGVDQ